MNLRDCFLKFANEHRFLLIALILSFIICVPIFIFLLIVFPIIPIILFLVPFLLVILISVISSYTYSKFPKLTKVISAFLNSIIIIASIVALIVTITFIQNPFPDLKEDTVYEHPIQYQDAKNSINAQSRIQHFPDNIPENAKHIRFHKDSNSWFGGEQMILEFDIDKQYIENELKKYKFILVDKNIEKKENEYSLNILNTTHL